LVIFFYFLVKSFDHLALVVYQTTSFRAADKKGEKSLAKLIFR